MLNSKKDRDRKERIDLLEKNLAADTNKKKETFVELIDLYTQSRKANYLDSIIFFIVGVGFFALSTHYSCSGWMDWAAYGGGLLFIIVGFAGLSESRQINAKIASHQKELQKSESID